MLQQDIGDVIRRKIQEKFSDLHEYLQQDIERILEIWADCRKKYSKNGPFLFGRFTIADAFYAPVVFRFRTYGVKVNKLARQYMGTMLHLEPMQEWFRDALQENEIIEVYEPYR